DLVVQLKRQYGLDVFIEPGNAVVGAAGFLVATVIDCFLREGKTVAVLDTSVNHNPEVFEYQRKPLLIEEVLTGEASAILVGCTCLAGDVFGEYRFNKPINVGDRVTFSHVGAYSLIKSNRFNGYNFPDIYTFDDSTVRKIKTYDYAHYREQWLT
ncbi:MAG: carboxynorspermidine decarboxylase, partial [Methylococcales bacterium]